MILIEFNELCPRFLEEFMARGLLPNFKRFYESSVVHTTDAGEEEPNLEPWIQWPTVHSGMPYSDHKIFHLGDGHKLKKKCVAEVLSDNDIRVGVFMSMNLNYDRLNGYALPDPWDKQGKVYPESIQDYFDTISHLVRESSENDTVAKKGKSHLLKTLLRHGLSFQTAFHVAKQVFSEQKNPALTWRRAAVFDRIQYDIFHALNRKIQPQFCTFFCNSTAHFQHYFWRNMEPEKFGTPPLDSDEPSYRDAILYGYQSMDIILRRFMNDYPNEMLMLCTALSQKPWLETTKCTFRPIKWDSLFEFAGFTVDRSAVKPVMAEQFHIDFNNEEEASKAVKALEKLTLEDEPLMSVKREGKNVFSGCRINDSRAINKQIVRASDGQTRNFTAFFQMIHTMRSGRHARDGVLWIRDGKPQIVNEKVPLTAIAPTILEHFQIDKPQYMKTGAIRLSSAA